MKLFDFNDPFFKPLWLRITIVLVAGTWGIFEFMSGATFWGTLFVGIAVVAFHGLFIAFNPREPDSKKED